MKINLLTITLTQIFNSYTFFCGWKEKGLNESDGVVRVSQKNFENISAKSISAQYTADCFNE